MLLLFGDHADDDFTIDRVERGGRFIKQQHRMAGDEAARDVDALLLAAREGGRRKQPQLFRQVEAGKQFARLAARDFPVLAQRHQRLGHNVERRDARHGAQELADIADGVAAHGKHGARAGRGEIDKLAIVGNDDLAVVDGVIAVEHFQDRAFAGTGRTTKHGAFAGGQRKRHIGHHRQLDAVAQMHGEALDDFGNNERRSHFSLFWFARGLVRKPASTFRDHALRPAEWRKREAGCRAHADRRARGR